MKTAEPRVLFVVGSLDVGGAERHLADIVPALQRQGIRAMIFVLSGRGEMATVLEGRGVTVVAPPLAEPLRSWPRVLRRALLLPLSAVSLAAFIRRARPDIVHFFLPEAYLIGGLITSVFPVPFRVMSRRSLNVYQQKHPLAFRLERYLHKRMAAALGNSRAVLDQLRAEGVDPDRLGLIYNGIGIADFSVGARPAMRKALGIPDGSLVMVVVANLIPYKGHADLIEALGRISAQLPPGWRMLCIGEDRGVGNSLWERARDLGFGDHLLWLGYRADARAILGAADIGILCSHQEGFSNAILEGMAAGLPMIATNVGGNAEAVQHNVTGLIVPPKDPDRIAEALVRLASDPDLRRRLGEAGRARAFEHFSLDRCVDGYEALYRALLAGRSPGELEQIRVVAK